MTLRSKLETSIIGQISTLNGAYQSIAHILSESNFESFLEGIPCKIIYRAVKNLYPENPIDEITVSTEVFKIMKTEAYSNIAYAISSNSGHYLSAENIHFHAYSLLELCIKDSLIETLSKINSDRALLNEIKLEIFQAINFGHDIFEIAEKAGIHLSENGFENEALLFGKLNENIVKKTAQIKKLDQVNRVISSLENLSIIKPSKKEAINNHVIEIIKLINSK